MRAFITRNSHVAIAFLALLHSLLYAVLVPPWQVPDEPAQYEYAALVSRLGRVPTAADHDPALEQSIVASLVQAHFFEYLLGHPPEPVPRTFDDARTLFFMPRQVGGDPPLYFLFAGMLLRIMAGFPIESQLLALRLIGACFAALTTLCAYAAAGELALGRGVALATGLFVALHPMLMFISASAGNDGLAILLGAALCWCILRIIRRPDQPGWAFAALLCLSFLGSITKRTLLALVLLLLVCAIVWGFFWLLHTARRATRLLWLAGAPLVIILLGWGAGAVHDQQVAADWYGPGDRLAVRILTAPTTEKPAFMLHQGQYALQALPDVTAEWAQNRELLLRARVWAETGAAQGHLRINFGWAAVEVPFDVTAEPTTVEMQTFIPLYCPYVHVEIHADNGQFYIDQPQALSDRDPTLNLLTNSDLTQAGLQPQTFAGQLQRYLRLRELGWVWRSGQLWSPPLGWDLVRIFFVSFWGQFGWMSLPLVGATPWEAALNLICGAALLGCLSWLATPHASGKRRFIAVPALIILAGLLLPLLNAYTQPRNQVIQQGRYLFPAIVPVALILVIGWRALIPHRWRAGALVLWAGFWFAFAGAALALVIHAYR